MDQIVTSGLLLGWLGASWALLGWVLGLAQQPPSPVPQLALPGPSVRPLHAARRASEGGGMYARAGAGKARARHPSLARDPRRITDAGHQAGWSCCMRLDEYIGRSACGPEAYCSCRAGRRVWNHCVASRWHVTGQTLD
ncbi:hypothetical protein ACLOJK_028437 [Asimina triloba]